MQQGMGWDGMQEVKCGARSSTSQKQPSPVSVQGCSATLGDVWLLVGTSHRGQGVSDAAEEGQMKSGPDAYGVEGSSTPRRMSGLWCCAASYVRRGEMKLWCLRTQNVCITVALAVAILRHPAQQSSLSVTSHMSPLPRLRDCGIPSLCSVAWVKSSPSRQCTLAMHDRMGDDVTTRPLLHVRMYCTDGIRPASLSGFSLQSPWQTPQNLFARPPSPTSLVE
jgi:hypothetical protein